MLMETELLMGSFLQLLVYLAPSLNSEQNSRIVHRLAVIKTTVYIALASLEVGFLNGKENSTRSLCPDSCMLKLVILNLDAIYAEKCERNQRSWIV